MNAHFNLNNGTSVTVIGTPEDVASCYLLIFNGLLEIDGAVTDETEDELPVPEETVTYTVDATVDQLLDYITRLKQRYEGQQNDTNNKQGGDTE